MTEVLQNPRFQHGLSLAGKQFYHAALEQWAQLKDLPPGTLPPEDEALLCDEMGKAYIQLADHVHALELFSKAAAFAIEPASALLYRMHVSMTYGRLAQHDRAQRLHTQIVTQAEGLSLPPQLLGYLYSNLGYVYGHSGFYKEAVTHTLTGLRYFQKAGVVSFLPDLYTNLGFLQIELEQYGAAETYLLEASKLYQEPLPAITELCRLYLVSGELELSAKYAEQALDVIWSSFINYEKEEIARLCHLFARLAYQNGDRRIALRLIEKSQLFFGQLGLWHEWNRVQSVMDHWEQSPHECPSKFHAHRMNELTQFVLLLDAMNAQEIIHDHFSALLDTRVLYARALAGALGFDGEEEQLLVYASRFADYGLTAVEPEVVLDPSRSAQASQHYRQHPILSVRMLVEIDVPEKVQQIILDHHERYDGYGYPDGKASVEIEPLARAFAIADDYATGIALEGRLHSDVLQSMIAEDHQYDPAMLKTFVALFES